MEERKTFLLEDEKGQTLEAETITMIAIEEKKYLIYSIKDNDKSSLVCASLVIKDEEGKDKLVDINEGEDKEKIKRFIESLSK